MLILLLVGCHSFSDSTIMIASKKTKLVEADIKLVMAYLEEGDFQEAKRILLELQTIDSINPAVWYVKGYFYERVGEFLKAQINYKKALRLNAKDGAAHRNYGNFLFRQGRYEEAMNEFLMAAEDDNYLETAGAFEAVA